MLHFLISKSIYSIYCFLTLNILRSRLGLSQSLTEKESNDSSSGLFSSKINVSTLVTDQKNISRKPEFHPILEELQRPVDILCGELSQEQCLAQPECFLCLYECHTYGFGEYCTEPSGHLTLSSDKVLNALLLSNGTLAFDLIPYSNEVTAVDVALDVPYKNLINITASYDPFNRRINCNLLRQNLSIVFPFHKSLNVIIKVYFGSNVPVPFIIPDQVRIVDPVISEIGPNSTLINHPTIFTFKFKRISSKHIRTVKLELADSIIACNIESNETVDFNCLIMITAQENWPGYLSIYLENFRWYSYNFSINPYPVINTTSPSQAFPGYLVPLHFTGTNFYSFRNLEVYVNYLGNKMLLNCTVVSDTELFCSNDKFPNQLPATGTFIWYSHSNRLFNITNFMFNANLPPDVMSLKHDKLKNQIRIAISYFHPDYLSNTIINFSCDCQANLEFECNQIYFNSLASSLNCRIDNSLNGTYDWVVVLSIGSYKFYLPLQEKPKYLKNYFFILLLIGLFVTIGILVWFLRKSLNQKTKSGIYSSSVKSIPSIKSAPKKSTSLLRMNSYTKFPTISRSDTKVTTKRMKNPSVTIN